MSFTGVGTVLSRGAGANPIPAPGSDTFVAVGRIRSISGPDISKEEAEDSTLDTAGGFKQFLSGLRDPGNIELSLSFEPGTTASPANSQQDLVTDFNAATAAARRNWRITWPDGTVLDVQGEVFNIAWNTEPNSPVEMTVTIRLNGAPTLTYP